MTSVAKMFSDSISTMMGPKMSAALLWAKIPLRNPAKYCSAASPTDPNRAPRAMLRTGPRSVGRIE